MRRTNPYALLFACALLAEDPAAAQEHSGHGAHGSPYAELTDRAIKALSEEEVRALREGEGMGYALSAELNGVPGPLHVQELSAALELTVEQARGVADIRERMTAAARELGARILELEGELDRRFAHGHLTPADVVRLSTQIGRMRGELRAAHLTAHLETAEVLTPAQVARYNQLRGYAE